MKLLLTTFLGTIALCQIATGKEETFEGVVNATLTRAGTQTSHYVFKRKGSQLRIENADNKLEPVNIIDLEARKLTIVYPHNTTFVHAELTRKPATGPGIASMPLPNQNMPATTLPGAASGKIGPSISPPPGFPTPPPMPSMPNMPQMPNTGGPRPGANPGMGAGMGMPPMPMPPPMAMMQQQSELKKTDQTKKIEGVDCTLYNLSQRGEQFEIWSTTDSSLFPFRLTERDFLGRRFGPRMLEETWPDLLQEKSLFPIEATLKMEPGGQERLSFKVDKIEKKKIEDESVFRPPEKYIEIQAPQF